MGNEEDVKKLNDALLEEFKGEVDVEQVKKA